MQAVTSCRFDEAVRAEIVTVKRHALIRSWQLLPLVLLLSASGAAASFIETFGNGSNDGNWRLTDNPARLLQIERGGGNPGAYLHGQVSAAVPTWYVPWGTAPTHFLGNYYAEKVSLLSFDLNIFSGFQAPQRAVTLDLRTTLGTSDFSKGLEAYKIGTDISTLPAGWQTYSFSLLAVSEVIPPGWVLLRGDGTAGTNADWRLLMRDVETIGFELGKPGFAYPALNMWDLGLDNVRIKQSAPESMPSSVFPITLAALALGYKLSLRNSDATRTGTLPPGGGLTRRGSLRQ